MSGNQPALFRNEALANRQGRHLGKVLIHQPLGYQVAAALAIGLLVLVCAFAYFGTYTHKASVTGLLTPEQGLFRLVAPSGGQLAEVHVREGQTVAAGQPLFAIATAQVTSAGQTPALVQEQLRQRMTLARDSAAFSTERLTREQALTARRLDALETELAQIAQELALIARRESLASSHRERIRLQVDAGFVSPAQLEQAESEMLLVRQQRHAAQRTQSTLLRDKATLQTVQEDMQARHRAQLTETHTALAVLRQELAEREAQREIISAAPFAGTITGVHAHAGSIVAPGNLLASIVPNDAKLVLHLYAPEQKSGFLQVGQSVRLRYAAFPYQKYGMGSGTVVSVTQSPYAPTELPPHVAMTLQQASAALPQALYYRVTVELDKQFIAAQGIEQPLKAGMLVEADIVQDKRRLYEWVLEPIYSVTGKFTGSGPRESGQ